MDNENSNQRGSRVARMSPRQLQRLLILGVAGVLALTLLVLGTIFLIDVITAPNVKQVNREPDSGLDAPDRNDNPDDNIDGGNTSLDNTMKKNFYTFLIVGTSDDYNTDTIMLGAVDTKALECNIISIPRDCMYDTDAKIKRINGAFGRGGGFNKSNGGIKNLCEVVQSVTGVYPQYYCVLKMDSFITVVDEIGGVEFDVPFHMYHEDADPKFHIDLPAGKRVLNGKEAIQLVRFRGYAMSDFGRITMQKQFLITTLQTVKDKFSLTNAAKIITTITKSMKTNMDAADAVWFYNNVVTKMDLNTNIVFHTLPTEGTGKYNGQDYVYIDKEATLKLVNETVNPYTTPITRGELHGILKLED